MLPLLRRNKKSAKQIFFFDFEATQDTIAQCKQGYALKKCCRTPRRDRAKYQRYFQYWFGQSRHVPDVVVAKTTCEAYEDDPFTPLTCDQCGNRCTSCNAWDKEAREFVSLPSPTTCWLREVIFEGESTLGNFRSWHFLRRSQRLFSTGSQHEGNSV